MAADFSISCDFIGLRDVEGKFASASTEGLFAAKFAEARELAASTQETYARGAPRGKGPLIGRSERFADSFRATAVSTPGSFHMELSTSQDKLRGWIRDGTAPHTISIKNKKVLTDGASFFGTKVRHPGTKPNSWEEAAGAKAEEELRFFGNRISAAVKVHFSGGA